MGFSKKKITTCLDHVSSYADDAILIDNAIRIEINAYFALMKEIKGVIYEQTLADGADYFSTTAEKSEECYLLF